MNQPPLSSALLTPRCSTTTSQQLGVVEGVRGLFGCPVLEAVDVSQVLEGGTSNARSPSPPRLHPPRHPFSAAATQPPHSRPQPRCASAGSVSPGFSASRAPTQSAAQSPTDPPHSAASSRRATRCLRPGQNAIRPHQKTALRPRQATQLQNNKQEISSCISKYKTKIRQTLCSH